MIKSKTATFIGHSECYGISDEQITKTIERLILQGVCEFLTGGQGRFDNLCAQCVHKLKYKYPHIKNNIVIPYLNFNIFNKDVFDCMIYPEGFENLHFVFFNFAFHKETHSLPEHAQVNSPPPCVRQSLR